MELAENHHAGRIGPLRRWKALAGPALLFVILTGFFWKLVLTDQYTWLDGSDTARMILPWFQLQAGEWHAGRLPLWDPYLWGGQPLLAQAQPGTAYPVNWLLFSLPLQDGWISQKFLHWYFVLLHYMAALFCYFLCRDLKRSRWASLIAGTVYGLAGFFGTTVWPQMLNGAIWAPLVFLFSLRVFRGERPVPNAALAGASLGLAWLAGHHQSPLYLSLTIGILWCYQMFRTGPSHWTMWKPILVFGLFAGLVGALQILPSYEYGQLASRWVGTENLARWNDTVPYAVHTRYGLDSEGLLSIVIPGIENNASPFMGIAAFSLALLAICFGWRYPEVRCLTVAGICGLLFALAGQNVLHGVIYSLVPIVEKARNPSHAIAIFNFAFAVLVAYGIDELSSQEDRWKGWPAGIAVASGSLLVFAAGLELLGKHIRDGRIPVAAFFALLFAAVLAARRLGRIGRNAACMAALCCIVMELGLVVGYHFPHNSEKTRLAELTAMAQDSDVVAFLRKQTRPFRVEVDAKDVPYNFGQWYGIETIDGYVAGVTSNRLVNDAYSARFRSLAGVAFSLSRKPLRQGWKQVFEGASGLKVFANPDVFPRAWAVHRVTMVNTEDQINTFTTQTNNDLHNSAVLLGGAPPALDNCAGNDQVEVLRHQSDRVEIAASLPCKGLVIVSDTFFPGWEARVDGRKTPIREAYGVFRAVEVAAGRHTITMAFRPKSIYLGALLSFAGLAGAALLQVKRRRPSAQA